MKNNSTSFAICTSNSGCEDLQLLKVYRLLPDHNATAEGYLRVIDDSGEDYLYPDHYFMAIELPPVAGRRLLAGFRKPLGGFLEKLVSFYGRPPTSWLPESIPYSMPFSCHQTS